jgi:hypothetical protein
MSQPESVLLANIRRALGASARHVRLFRNHAGTFWAGRLISRSGGDVHLQHAQETASGLHVGAGDLIGFVTKTVTAQMVGSKVAIFASVEVKTEAGRVSPDQRQWCDQVNAAGGIAGIVRTEEEALQLVAAS